MNTKTCNTCGVEYPKTNEFFHYINKAKGYLKGHCKECQKAREKKRYQNNKEKILEQQREYKSRPGYKEKNSEYQRKYYQNNKEKTNERQREIKKKRRKENPQIRRMECAHRAIRDGMLNPGSVTKRNKYWNALPYTPWDLRKHLEGQFEDWMNWGNRGKGCNKWGLDHIIAQSHFYWETLEDKGFQECWALSNLQPLCNLENIKKGNRVDTAKHS